jgi:hypothetical protein
MLKQLGVVCWRNNVGRKHNLYFGLKGSGDILGITNRLFKKGRGKFLSIEVKDKKGIVSDEQKAFIEMVNQAGGVAIVARGLDNVSGLLKIKVYK